MQRLKRKIEGSRDILPAPIIREEEDGDIGIIFYGSMQNSIVEIDDLLEKRGMSVSTCRVRALPYHSEVEGFIERHDRVVVLEINRDGQLYGILRKELPPNLIPKLVSVAYSDGLPPKAREYANRVTEVLEG